MRKVSILAAARRGLWRFPLRSGLTMVSAILGVAGALGAVNYALGGRKKVTDELGRLGVNVLIVSPQQSRTIGGRARTGAQVTTLTETDYAAIRREVPSLQTTSAFATRSFSLKAGDLAKKSCVVVGVEPGYMTIKEWSARDGALFGAGEMKRMARVVLLGSSVARDLFEEASPVGQRVLINRVPFEVIGVMRERGQSLDAANEDDQVYVPLTTAMHRLANVDYFSGILLEVDRWEDMDRAAAAAASVLRRRHRTLGKLPDDFQLMNQKQLLDTQTGGVRPADVLRALDRGEFTGGIGAGHPGDFVDRRAGEDPRDRHAAGAWGDARGHLSADGFGSGRIEPCGLRDGRRVRLGDGGLVGALGRTTTRLRCRQRMAGVGSGIRVEPELRRDSGARCG